MFEKLKAFVNECVRVLRVTKKPNKEEFSTIVKVSAIGLAIIGLIGMIVYVITEMIKNSFKPM
jgi:protein transport protein SEC61 subunit gamma and related proteins